MATRGAMSIDPSTLQNGPFSTESTQDSKVEHLLGPLLGACVFILLIFIAMYVFAKRTDEIEEEEAASKEENRHIFLKTHMNIKMYTDNVSECIDDCNDEEAQKKVHKGPTILKTVEEGEEESCLKTSIDDSEKEADTLDVYYFEETHHEGEKDFCPICHEQFQASEEVAYSKNESCCQSVFHTECIISWLMRDHGDCPLCRGIFVPESKEVDVNNNVKST